MRWDSLLGLFRSTFLELHSLPAMPLLHMSLQAGIASLKTPVCCPLPNPPPSSSTTDSTPLKSTVASSNGSSGVAAMRAATSDSIEKGAQPAVHALEGRPSPECPICSSSLHDLAPEVPYSHHVNSTIVCGITGKVVEGDGGEGGQLVALVSRVSGEGRVYSKDVSRTLAESVRELQLNIVWDRVWPCLRVSIQRTSLWTRRPGKCLNGTS